MLAKHQRTRSIRAAAALERVLIERGDSSNNYKRTCF
jgi:hypothetical protein